MTIINIASWLVYNKIIRKSYFNIIWYNILIVFGNNNNIKIKGIRTIKVYYSN